MQVYCSFIEETGTPWEEYTSK